MVGHEPIRRVGMHAVVAAANARAGFTLDLDELVWIRNRKCLQQHLADYGEERGVHSDAERERHNGHHRKGGGSPKGSEDELSVAGGVPEPVESPHGANVLGKDRKSTRLNSSHSQIS